MRCFAHLANHLTHQKWSFCWMECLVYHLLIFFLSVWFETFNPRCMLGCIQQFRHSCKRFLTVAPHFQINRNILVELCMVYVEMDNLSLFGISGKIARHTVIKTHADSNEQVTLIGHHIRTKITVHAQDTHVQTVVGRNGGKSHERSSAWKVSLFQERAKFLCGITQFHTLSHQNKRFHAVIDHLGGTLNVRHVQIWIRVITANEIHLCRFKLHHARLRILGEIEHHRTRATTLGDIERTSHSPSHIFRTTNLIAPLADR